MLFLEFVLARQCLFGGVAMKKFESPLRQLAPLFLVVGVLLLIAFISGLPTDYPNSTSALAKIRGEDAIHIEREKYYARHFQWSGIFPVMGGFHADPHYFMTPVFEFSQQIKDRLGVETGRYQGVDVNRWFDDETSEILLLLELDGEVFEFPIRSTTRSLGKSLVSARHDIISWLQGDQLVFFTSLYPPRGEVRHLSEKLEEYIVLLVIALPIDEGGSVSILFSDEQEFDQRVMDHLADRPPPQIIDRFCKGNNFFQAIFERYAKC